MERQEMIVVTGAAGFIGSCLTGYLNTLGFENIVIVDEFSREDKIPNWIEKKYTYKIERDGFFDWLTTENPPIAYVFHLGARTDTTEFDYAVHERLNVNFSKDIWQYCTQKQIPLVYASSAATYGAGELGYEDSHSIVNQLQPLNAYGISKNEFDKWAILQKETPPAWFGLKFFNVYGPNEFHKGRMASVIFHSVNQIRTTGLVKLFKSHRPNFKDGQQLRDFIYVKDLLKVAVWLMGNQPSSGLYNLGTGIARSFEDLVKATFAAMDLTPKIEFIDMPEDIREKYQYFTEANMSKLKAAGYLEAFSSLEDGVDDYVRKYLLETKYY